MENPGTLGLILGSGFEERGGYGPVQVRHSGPIGSVLSTSPALSFTECTLDGSRFTMTPDARVSFRNCEFKGEIQGLDEENFGLATGNARAGSTAGWEAIESLLQGD